jgi:hypothetical protein
MIGALVAGQVGSGGAVLSSYESIATSAGTGSSTTVTFSSIPSGFKHLQIRALLKNTQNTNFESNLDVRFNSDTGTNYANHYLRGNGATPSVSGAANNDKISPVAFFPYLGKGTSATMGVVIIDILDYASTTKNKTLRAFGSYDNNGEGYVMVASGLWMNTAAITSISLIEGSSYNWATSATFALYGIKEA